MKSSVCERSDAALFFTLCIRCTWVSFVYGSNVNLSHVDFGCCVSLTIVDGRARQPERFICFGLFTLHVFHISSFVRSCVSVVVELVNFMLFMFATSFFMIFVFATFKFKL